MDEIKRNPEDVMPEEDDNYKPEYVEDDTEAPEPEFATKEDAEKMKNLKSKIAHISEMLREIAGSK